MHIHTQLLAAEENSGGSGIASLGILLLIPVAMYFLMIRPQRRRMREQQALQTGLEVGDEVVTTSGIYGFITGFEDDRVWVEIDDDVQVRLARAAIQNKVDTSAAPAPSSGTSEATDSADDVPELTEPSESDGEGRGERPTSKRGRAARDDAE